MTVLDPLDGIPSSKPSRRDYVVALTGTLVRLGLGTLLIYVMLMLVPSTPDGRMAAPIAVAAIGSTIYILESRRQLRRIVHSKFPGLMAGESLVLLAAMFLAVFAMIYVSISYSDTSAFTEPLDAFTSYYFALTVLATVGFGDITPVTTMARAVTMVQMALDLVFVALLIRVVSSAARKGLQHRGKSVAVGADGHEGQSTQH